MTLTNGGKAGIALFLGVLQFGIFEMIAEFVYPNYSVSQNYISDLGPPCGTGASCGSQNSWIIFDTSIAIMGVAILISALYLYRHFRWKPTAGLVALAGIGAIGVGIFNESAPYDLHGIFSLVTFLGIGLAAVVSGPLQKPPLRYFGIVLGAVTLISLLLYVPDSGVSFGAMLGIGPGGLERMIVYPVLFWSLAFAGHLMGLEDRPS